MRIAAYCRVSTDKEAQLDSLKNQKEYFKEYAEKNGHLLIKLYVDEGISGKQKSNRFQFLQMISDAKEYMFDMIVTKDISRFARNTVDALTTIRELRDLGIEVLFLTNNQTILGNSEFIITLFSAIAQEESANLSKRVKFGKKKVAEKGIVPNFVYGYNRISKFELEINENQAYGVRTIFDLYVNKGWGCAKITNYLIDNNICTYKGSSKYWNTKTVRRILRNEIYIGIVSNNKSEVVDFLTGKSINKQSDEWYKKEYPEIAIIDKELFNKAQELFDRRQSQYKNQFPKDRFSDKYIFSGIIKCACCGRSYSRKSYTYKNTRVYWVCPANDHYSTRRCANKFKINEIDIINQLEKYFKEVIKNKDKFIEKYIFDYYNELEKNDSFVKERDEIKKFLIEIRDKKDKFIELYANNIINMKELKERTESLDKSIKEKESRLFDIKKYIEKTKNIYEVVNTAVSSIEELSDVSQWSNFIIREIIEKIEVAVDGTVKILLRTQ